MTNMARYNYRAAIASTVILLDKLLFTAGPVEVRREVLEAMSRPMITHRGKEYKQLHASIVEKLRSLLGTDNCILFLVSSATGAMEAGVRSAVQKSIMHLTCGAFAERWEEISRANGKFAASITAPWGEAIDPLKLDRKSLSGYEAVAVTHNETSTGVMNPLEQIADKVHESTDALLFVDAVTSAFANRIDLSRIEPDLFLFGTQKALALPPGLAIAVVSDRLLEKAKNVADRGKYLDLVETKEFADRNLVPSTPPVSLLYALDFQLDRISREGLDNRADRHARLSGMARDWARKHLALFPKDNYSNSVTCVRNSSGKPYSDIDARLADRGYQISEGYGKLKESTFRIGHMGDLTVKEMDGLLSALSEVM